MGKLWYPYYPKDPHVDNDFKASLMLLCIWLGNSVGIDECTIVEEAKKNKVNQPAFCKLLLEKQEDLAVFVKYKIHDLIYCLLKKFTIGKYKNFKLALKRLLTDCYAADWALIGNDMSSKKSVSDDGNSLGLWDIKSNKYCPASVHHRINVGHHCAYSNIANVLRHAASDMHQDTFDLQANQNVIN
jgi:hypothetical protein